MHGAKELGLSIRDYFSKPEYVAEGQLRMQKKYGHDCVSQFFYAPIEVEAWGAEVIYREDGPPNSGEPFLRDENRIGRLQPPDIKNTPCLIKVLEATRLLKKQVADKIPIIGVVMSPFSLPVMQMGFERYLCIMYEKPDLFEPLMQVNESFCVEWANAQLEAGATAICYFDPLSSSSMTGEAFSRKGLAIARRSRKKINGPIAIHLASGRTRKIMDGVVNSGASAVGCSYLEDLAELKAICKGKITLIGNLNGVEMARWTPFEAKMNVRKCIAKAGPGGGFILSDAHGEIPFQVSDEVLQAISESAREFGKYPIQLGDSDGK